MKHLLHLLLFLLLFASCKKDEIKMLPPVTTSGANTMGAIVNGKAWVADASYGFNMKKFSIVYSYYYPPHKQLTISARRVTEDENSDIQLALEDVRERGTQYFSFDTGPAPDQLRFQNHAMYREFEPGSGQYITTSRHTGSVTFTKVDTVNRIIAGVFEFTAESLDGSGQTVRVTDGRFDIGYGKK